MERQVQFVRGSFFAGEDFVDLADAQRRAETWCRQRAGMRIMARPAATGGGVRRGGCPGSCRRRRRSTTCRSMSPRRFTATITSRWPGRSIRCPALIGARVQVRADRALVPDLPPGPAGQGPSPPGARPPITDPDDLPATKTVYAMRDLDRLRRMAAEHGPAIGAYATALLDIPLPWTKMRQVYAQAREEVGPVASRPRAPAPCNMRPSTSGSSAACSSAAPRRHLGATGAGTVIAGRFARDPEHFAVARTAEAAR